MGSRERLGRGLLIVVSVLSVVGSVDSIWNLAERMQGINLDAIVTGARLISGPLALVLALFLWLRRPVPSRDPTSISRPEWDTANQLQHYEGIRKMAREAISEFRSITADEVTVRDQTNLRNLADAVDYQVGNYSDLWAGSSYWDEKLRSRWASTPKGPYDGPPWGQQLWDRINYAVWWIGTHDPTNWEFEAGSGYL